MAFTPTPEITIAEPISIPILNVLPPSSDTESWSCSPSPQPHRYHSRSRNQEKRRAKALQEDTSKNHWDKGRRQDRRQSSSHAPPLPPVVSNVEEEEQGSPSVLLLPPSRSWSRSSSLSRRSRWSIRSLLSKDSDCDSSSTASNSPRSTPGSSPSLRRRVLGGRASEGETGGDRSAGGSESPLPPTPSSSTSSYPLAARHFTRNAKKMQSWYNVLSPTYKQRNEDFRKLFKKLPDTERLIVDYSCALQRDILLQGRLYLSENWLCFYSNIFRWETTITILLKDVTSLTKEKTAKLIPNAIQISTEHEKHFFTSFGARDRSYMMIFRLWQNALMDKTLSPKELWHIVHQCYGTELGLTSEDDDYVSPTAEHMNGLLPGEEPVSVTDLLDLGSVSVPPVGSSPPSSASVLPCASGSSPPSSYSSSCQPVEVPSTRASIEPEPSPPSSQSSLPPATNTGAASPSTVMEEGGDSQSESANQSLQSPPTVPHSLGNLSSLDITNDEELPTDPSNSSDTQEESEVESFCADLSGRLHINTVVRMSVDKLHDLLFSDTHFIQHLFSQRHFTDLSVHEWQQDSSSGNSSRVLSYTIAINNPLGPKTAPVVETQTLHKSSTRGECYVVDSEVITSGIPYQDYFYTVHRYCLTSVNKHKSRLRVSSDICYRKQPWSLVKALIEKNTWSGIEEYYRHMEMEVCKLETLLQSEVTVVSTGEVPSADSAKTPPGLRRRKRNCPRRAGDRERERDGAGGGGGERGDRGIGDERERREAGAQYVKLGERWRGAGNNNSISTILLIVSFMICVSLVVLVALNMMLFYKLWALERAAHTLETWHSYSLTDSPLPQTAGEWAQVLQLQRQFHQAQMNKWQQILQSSVTLLDQMKQSLEKLHRGMITPEVQQESESEAETLTDQ
ncbi:protein Aster-A isoform X1 [Puntigrus tetrazona]|uniref:protein Aster-A isoform X1 n=1 Tax=Puntigrus tetrazona TaxID=1606681 RepID=UPI001C8937F9|nr:protein Aster-A isoform X1 [Puntigrus tetrazona]XP_043116808.1 protein Aster-A isoform X1 [Puntigrus tetrazona]XP_043116809.1 protein Aster-A isoform X1 [Puntigrus tetrazona]